MHIPFKIYYSDVVRHLKEILKNMVEVPPGEENNIQIIDIDNFVIPMYIFDGLINGSWTATAIQEKKRLVKDSQNKLGNEDYTEYLPISGYVHDSFWIMALSNNKSNLPYIIRQHSSCITFDRIHDSESRYVTLNEIDEYNSYDSKIERPDTDPIVILHSDAIRNYIENTVSNLVSQQISGKYKDLKYNFNYQEKKI